MLTATYLNQSSNRKLIRTTYVYFVGINLTPGKTVASVQLPNISSTVGATTAAMHIFAMSLDPYSLSAAANNVGVTANNNTNPGNFDGVGNSFSKTALANAGLASGATVTSNGVSFSWPASAGTGGADNVVASGQTIAYTGTGSTLGFLVSSGYGASSGTGVITYTDGTTSTFTLGCPDWWGPAGTATAAFTAAYENQPGNTILNQQNLIFYVGVPLTAGKTIVTIQLPNISDAPAPGVPSLHVFALGTK